MIDRARGEAARRLANRRIPADRSASPAFRAWLFCTDERRPLALAAPVPIRPASLTVPRRTS